MTLSRLLLALASSSSVFLAAEVARADEPLVSQYETSRVGLATEIWPTQHVAIATMAVEGQFAVTKNAVIDFAFPNWAFGGASGKGYVEFGGVMIGAHAVGHVDRDAVVWGGFQLIIPTTWKNPALDQLAFDVAAVETRALFDLGRLLPETLTLKFPLGAELKFDFVYIRPSFAIPIYIPVGDDNDAKTGVGLETAVEIEARHPIGFGGGLRFQAVVELTDNGDPAGNADHAQTALEPFIGYEGPGDKLGAYARLGLLVALDTPLGFGFDQGKLAALDIKVGGKF